MHSYEYQIHRESNLYAFVHMYHEQPDNITHPTNRKIPHLFHVTSKSRCMTPSFASNIDKWKKTLGSKYSVYIHDDDAVNKFIYEKRWWELPELPEIMACVTAGVSCSLSA